MDMIKWNLWLFLHPIELRMMGETYKSKFWRERFYVAAVVDKWYLTGLSTSSQPLNHRELTMRVGYADVESLWFIRQYIRPLYNSGVTVYLPLTNCIDRDRAECNEFTCMFCNPTSCNLQATIGTDTWARHNGPRVAANIAAFASQWKRSYSTATLRKLVAQHA